MSLFARTTHPSAAPRHSPVLSSVSRSSQVLGYPTHKTLASTHSTHCSALASRFLVIRLTKPWQNSSTGSWSSDSQNLGKTALPVPGHPTHKTLAKQLYRFLVIRLTKPWQLAHRRFLVNLLIKPRTTTHRTSSHAIFIAYCMEHSRKCTVI